MAKSYKSRAPGLRSVRLDLNEADHAALRVLAAQAGLPMSQYVREIVQAHLAAQVPPKKNPKKS
jgi:predicted DNA binding CopG/RHH family protein